MPGLWKKIKISGKLALITLKSDFIKITWLHRPLSQEHCQNIMGSFFAPIKFQEKYRFSSFCVILLTDGQTRRGDWRQHQKFSAFRTGPWVLHLSLMDYVALFWQITNRTWNVFDNERLMQKRKHRHIQWHTGERYVCSKTSNLMAETRGDPCLQRLIVQSNIARL